MEEYCPKSHHLYPRTMSELTLILLIGLWGSKEDILRNLKDRLKHFDQNYSLLNSKPVHADFSMHLLTAKRVPTRLPSLRARTRIRPRTTRPRPRTRIPPRTRPRARNESTCHAFLSERNPAICYFAPCRFVAVVVISTPAHAEIAAVSTYRAMPFHGTYFL